MAYWAFASAVLLEPQSPRHGVSAAWLLQADPRNEAEKSGKLATANGRSVNISGHLMVWDHTMLPVYMNFWGAGD